MRALAIALLVALAPSAARAAEGSGSVANLLWSALNLAILVGVIVYFARKPIRDYFASRRHEIESDLDASARLLAEAEARLREWQTRVDRLDQELGQIRERARQRTEADRARILKQAQATADGIRRDAAGAIDREVERARAALRDEAASLAVELAAGILQEKVTKGDHDRLVDDFVDRVERSNGAGAER